jgi:hypothetical protein
MVLSSVSQDGLRGSDRCDVKKAKEVYDECIQRIGEQEERYKKIWDGIAAAECSSFERATQDALQCLNVNWSREDRSLRDYFDLAIHERNVSPSTFPPHIEDMWDTYIRNGLCLRARLLHLNRLLNLS